MMKVCSVPHCSGSARTKGLCQAHYKRQKRTGSLMSERPIGTGRGLAFLERSLDCKSSRLLELAILIER